MMTLSSSTYRSLTLTNGYGNYFGSQSSRYMEKFTDMQAELRHEDNAMRQEQLTKLHAATYGSQSTPTQTMERASAESLAAGNPIGDKDE